MKDKIILGVPSSQQEGNEWYRRGNENITDVNKLLLRMSGAKTVSFFKVSYYSRGGSRLVTQYWRTANNGYMICVDESICKINIVLGMPSVRSLEACTKRDYQRAFNKVLKVLSI